MKKTLQDLTIKDNFMFGAVMTDPENCKGVRLDVYAKDDTNTRYNIEMQVLRNPLSASAAVIITARLIWICC